MNVWICLLWSICYAVLQLVCLLLLSPVSVWLMIAATLVYWSALWLFLQKRNLRSAYGLCLPKWRQMYAAALLLLIPIGQCLWNGLPKLSLKEMLWLFLVALAEEIAFRVLLPKIVADKFSASPMLSVIFSSICFAVLHGVSLFSDLSLIAVAVQILYAFCAGCAFCAVVQKTKSVLPTVLLHTLINLTTESKAYNTPLLLITLAYSVLLAGFSIFHFQKSQKGAVYL